MLWVGNVVWRLRAFVYCTPVTARASGTPMRRYTEKEHAAQCSTAVQSRAQRRAEQKSRAEQSAQQKSRAEDTAAQRADGRVQRRQRRGQAAHHADCRNPSPVIAMKMYAFLVRYLTTFSKHQSAQAQARKATLSSLLRSCSSFV